MRLAVSCSHCPSGGDSGSSLPVTSNFLLKFAGRLHDPGANSTFFFTDTLGETEVGGIQVIMSISAQPDYPAPVNMVISSVAIFINGNSLTQSVDLKVLNNGAPVGSVTIPAATAGLFSIAGPFAFSAGNRLDFVLVTGGNITTGDFQGSAMMLCAI